MAKSLMRRRIYFVASMVATPKPITSMTMGSLKSLPTQTLHMKFIFRKLYHKKLHSPMLIFYHVVYLIFLSDLLLLHVAATWDPHGLRFACRLGV
jgi:uncharacterized protein (DUF1810 family)